MKEKRKPSSLPRREALFTFLAGAGAMGMAPWAQAHEKTSCGSEPNETFKPEIPFSKPANNEELPFGLPLYGQCNGRVDIIMTDYKPALNKYGQMLDKDGQVVTDPKLARKAPQKNILLFGRDLPGPELYGKDPKKVTLPDGTTAEVGADFGGHYHEEAEMIYCPNGKMLIEFRENSGKNVVDFEGDTVLEAAPEPQHGERLLQYVAKTGATTELIELSQEIQSVVLERGGMVNIPGRCYHSVIMLETGDMLAYLPDGKRWAEQAYSSPGSSC